MNGLTHQDLEQLASRLERHADGHFKAIQETLAEYDTRIRDMEILVGRHDERITSVEDDTSSQWQEINAVRRRNGEGEALRPHVRLDEGPSVWRGRARAGGGLALLLAVFELLHQLGNVVMDLLKQLRH